MDDDLPGKRFVRTLLGKRALQALARRFDATLVNGERLPRLGGALLVSNHTLFGLDSFPFAALVTFETGRVVRFLGDRNLFRIPFVASALRASGAVPGAPEKAIEMLSAGELVGVYPGGVDDSFKLSSEAYRLQWGERSGFARVAMAARVPIVPIAATGIDELFVVERRETRLGRLLGGSPRYDIPLPKSLLPRKVPLVYHVLAEVPTDGDPQSPTDVALVRDAVADAIEAVLAQYRNAKGLADAR